MRTTGQRSWQAVLGGALIAVVALGDSASAGIVQSFYKVAETGSTFTSFSPIARINATGTVVFEGETADGTSVVFTGSAGSLTNIASPLNGFTMARVADIADSGAVVFEGRRDGREGIYLSDNGTITPIAFDTGILEGGAVLDEAGPAALISDLGTVLFQGTTNVHPNGGIYSSPPPRNGLFTIAATPFPITRLGIPAINDQNKAAFKMELDSGREVITHTAHGDLVDTDGEFAGFDPFLDINDFDTVAFTGVLDDTLQGVFTVTSSGAVTKIADTSGVYNNFVIGPAISSDSTTSPTVAFTAVLNGDAAGVFTGPAAIADKVLVTGDVLFGKTVDVVIVVPGGLNDADQLALEVRFTDDSEAIVRATPDFSVALADLDNTLQMTTRRASRSSVGQSFSRTDEASETFRFAFDHRFLTNRGRLTVLLSGVAIGSLPAPERPGTDFETYALDLDLSRLFDTMPDELTLEFQFHGPPGATVQIDDVVFPGLKNGDFQTGFMEAWEPETGLGGAVAAVAEQYTFTRQEEAPEARSLAPLGGALLGIGLLYRRTLRRPDPAMDR